MGSGRSVGHGPTPTSDFSPEQFVPYTHSLYVKSVENNNPQLSKLAELVRTLSVVHSKVTLASGGEADFYVDMRHTTLRHEAASLVGHVMIDSLEENDFPIPEIDTVGGLTMGADLVASAVLYAMATRGLDLGAFVVREIAKGHGMRRQIEGPEMTDKRVVVLEDTSTTGGSPLQAMNILETAGAKVVIMTVIANHDTKTQQQIEEAGYPCFTALRLTDLGLSQNRGLRLQLDGTRICEQLISSGHQGRRNEKK